MSDEQKWRFKNDYIQATDICDETGICFSNRGIVTRLNCYEKDINELKMENDMLLGEIDMLREDKMTEKTFTSKEINKKIAEYFKQYMKLYVNDKMSFAEFSLIKSTLTDIQLLFSEDSE